ncbi:MULTISPECIES: MucBP domain-containing protein [unclassified Facklamia]|uniref:MucBP domain-containing protein n=1 Tax=Aerococcaceae TaxID=186827 RepID=UPI0013CF8C29|nr:MULTISPECIES: MucBP domain-containing protein [unclassified Facklamia]QQD66216.1 MucBP domain-containing protein [Aerococcaceae bacterium zg-252]
MFFKRKQRFSIRKYKIGVCSVLLGTSIVMGTNQASAEELVSTEPVLSTDNQVDDSSLEDTTTVSEESADLVQESNSVEEGTNVVVTPVIDETTESIATALHLVVHTKVTVVNATNLNAGEKAAVEALVRADNNLGESYQVIVANDGTVRVLENGVEVASLPCEEIIEVAVYTEEVSPEVTELEEEAMPTTNVVTAVTPNTVVPTEDVASTTDLEAVKAEKIRSVNTFTSLTPTVRGEYVSRLQQAVDVAALNIIAEEARRLQRRAAFPNQGEPLTTGTGFRVGETPATPTATEGRKVTPKVTVEGTNSALNVAPTLVANPFKVNLSFEGQELHKDDYFYIEGQDAPVELPRKIVITNPDTKEEVVIGTVERVGYESDYYRAQDSQDPTRFDLSASSDYMTKKIKYKVTFNENVEGLKDVKAEINRNANIQTVAVSKPHTAKFKVLVNDDVVVEKEYTQNPFNNGVQTNGGTSYAQKGPGDSKPYLRFNTMLYDFRPLGEPEDIAFSKEVENDAILTFNGEVGGLPNGFVAKIKAKDTNPNPYIWGDNLMLGTRLPVYYVPYDKDGKPQANSTDESVYVTPKDTYMIIEKISEDKKEATIRFFGDYSKPGFFINGTMHPDKEEAGKTSKFGVKLLNKEWSTANPGNSADLHHRKQIDDPDNPGKSITVDDPDKPGDAPGFHLLTFFDHNGNPINARANQTGGNYRYADSARFTALPVTASNPEIINKGTVIVNYVDTDGNKIEEPVTVVADRPVETNGVKAMYDTLGNISPEIKHNGVTYKPAPVNPETPYAVGTLGEKGNLVTSNKEGVIAANDPKGIAPSGDLMQGTHHVTYVYKAVKGNVDVYFVDEKGNTLSPKENDTTDGNIDAAYDTDDNHHKPEITVNGKVYAFKELSKTNIVDGKKIETDELNHIGGTTGNIKEGTTHVIKVYALKPGSVFVNYEDKTTGQPIAKKVTDTDNKPDGTEYDTYDRKPEKLEGTDGSTYYLAQSKPKDGSAPESGEVTAGVNKEVTYLYEKAGNVKVHYVNTQGEEIQAPVDDVVNGKPGSDYETADRKDQTITKGDVTYVFKQIQTGQPGNASEKGQIKAGETLHVTYVYDVPEKPVEKTGSVFVKFEDKMGNPIKDKDLQPNDENFVIDTDKKPVGEHYETFDNKPEKITTKDDKVYYLAQTEPKENSAPEKGEVTENDQTVTYVYEQAGSVVVRYVNEQGQLLKDKDVEDETNVKPGTQYNTSEQKDPTITKDNVEYVFKEIQTGQPGNEPENGVVQAGKTLVVTYVYAVKPAPEAPKDPQHATITYYDVTDKKDPTKINEDDKEQLGDVDKTNGVEGENSPYTTVKRLEDYLNKGYELVNDGVPSPITFDGKADTSEDDPSQKFEVTLKHKTTPITPDTPQPKPGTPINPNNPDGPKWPDLANELERTATRTIRYRYENTPDDDTMKVFPDVVQTVKFRRTATVDHVTGKVTYSDWKAIVDEAPAVISGSKEGHTHYNQADDTKVQKDVLAQTAMISKDGVISGLEDQKILYAPVTPEVPVPIKQHATITYKDVTDPANPTQLGDVDKESGVAGDKSDYTTNPEKKQKRVQDYLDKGYEVVDDNVPTPIIFDNEVDNSDEDPTQKYEVTLKHAIEPVDPDSPKDPNQPINPNNPEGPKWPVIDKANVEKTATRTIRYRYKDKPGINEEAVFDDIVQTVKFKRTANVDKVTGEIVGYGEWVPVDPTAPAVKSKDKVGYTFDKDAPAETAMISTDGVISGISDQLVLYAPVTAPEADKQYATITYYDVTDPENPVQIEGVDKTEGQAGDTSDYTTETRIKMYTDKGWELVSDGVPKPIVLDNKPDASQEKPSQQFIVTLKHKVTPVTPDTPDTPENPRPKPGDPVNPEDPRTPVWPNEVGDLVREATRTIRYRYEGKEGNDDEAVFKDDVQKVRFTRTVTMDHVTGTYTVSPWKAEVAEAPAVVSPEKAGYSHYYKANPNEKDAPKETAMISETGEITGLHDQLIVYVRGQYVPYIPQDPANPTDPEDPHNPTIPGEPGEELEKVPYDETPEDPKDDPRLPDVPGYIPVDPMDPTNPLPKDPGGYIPPTPTNPKETPVPYLPAGTVVVRYEDTEGNTIKDQITDTEKSLVGTPYDTTDDMNPKGELTKPTEITFNGDKYVLVPSKTRGEETGKVVKGETVVTYVYQKVGSWIPLIPGVPGKDRPEIPYPFDPEHPDSPIDPKKPNDPDKPNTPPVIPYVPGFEPKDPTDPSGNTPLIPVDPEDPKQGYVPPVPNEPGEDTFIPYVPVGAKVGSVIVHYVNTNGETIAKDRIDTPISPVGTDYDTTDSMNPENESTKPERIELEDGTVYVLVKTMGAETGKVVEGTTEVTYVYQKVGSWIPEIPGVPSKDRPKLPYPFDPENPDSPVDPTKPNDPNQPNTPPVIPYVPGYIPNDPEGNPLKPVDPEDPKQGYVPPVPNKPGEDTHIPYVPENPATPEKPDPMKPGNYVPYVPKDPENPNPKDPDPNYDLPKVPYDETPENPKDNPPLPYVPGHTPKDPDGNPLKPKDPNDPTQGYIPPTITNPEDPSEDTPVPYVPNGSYVPHIEDPDPNRPKDPDKVPYDETPEDPQDNPPLPYVPGYTPKDPDGNPLKPKDPNDPTQGYIPPTITNPEDPSEDTPVPYVPNGSYVPHIEDPDPNRPKDPNKVPYDETPEDPQDNPPLPYVPGYEPKDPNDPTGNTPLKPVDPNDPTKGYIPPTITEPNDPTKDTLVPYKPVGTVIVRYKDTDGNEIAEPVIDTPTSNVGTPYDTTDHIKPEITHDGHKYVLVPSKTEGMENGKVVKGETVVTYIYQKVGNWIPEIPGVPNEERPVVPYPFDPENPDSPVDPNKPGVPPIPFVPGYIPNDPDGNPLKPVDPNDPTKGYIPPVPTNPGEDLHIPYVPTTPEVPEQPEKPEVPSEPSKPATPEQPGKDEVKKSSVLPNTGETDSVLPWSAAALSILAGLGLVARGRKEEE